MLGRRVGPLCRNLDVLCLILPRQCAAGGGRLGWCHGKHPPQCRPPVHGGSCRPREASRRPRSLASRQSAPHRPAAWSTHSAASTGRSSTTSERCPYRRSSSRRSLKVRPYGARRRRLLATRRRRTARRARRALRPAASAADRPGHPAGAGQGQGHPAPRQRRSAAARHSVASRSTSPISRPCSAVLPVSVRRASTGRPSAAASACCT